MSDLHHTLSGEGDSTVVNRSIDRSVLIEEAVDRYLALLQAGRDVSPDEIAENYSRYGSALQSSIVRQIEVEKYFHEQKTPSGDEAPVRWPAVGETLGEFKVLELLGRGAFARVYLCAEPRLSHRQMVLKVGRTSFHEAQTLSRLQHPGIVPIYSIAPWGETTDCVICMPFMGRSTLADLVAILKSSPEPWNGSALTAAGGIWILDTDVLASPSDQPLQAPGDFASMLVLIATQIASALAYAHRCKVVHGDIKPTNILLTQDGRPLLLDFNLSGETGGVAARGGTLPYMPPEQLHRFATEDAANVAPSYDQRSDLYSLGACLFELATGRPPIELSEHTLSPREVARKAMQCLVAQEGSWEKRLTRVDPRLARIIAACLQRDPGSRPASAEDLLDQLRRLDSVGERALRFAWKRRRGLRRTAIGALVGAVVAGGYWASLEPRYVRLSRAAAVARSAGRLADAIADLRKAALVSPTPAATKYTLGWALVEHDELEAAKKVFLEIKDAHRNAKAALAYAYQLQREANLAIYLYNEAIESGDVRVAVLNNAAVALDTGLTQHPREEDVKYAASLLLRAFTQAPELVVVLQNLVQLELQVFQHDATILTALREHARRLARHETVDRELVAQALICGPEVDERDLELAIDVLFAQLRTTGMKNPAQLESPVWAKLEQSPRYRLLLATARDAAGKQVTSKRGSRLLSVE